MSSFGHREYQNKRCSELSDQELIMGMLDACQCTSEHHKLFADHLETDECRIFIYPNGGADHFNVRWFNEWCKENRPKVIERIHKLRPFL